MLYLRSFTFPTASDEEGFLLNYPYQLEMGCYSHTNVYPFKLLPQKGLRRLEFAPVTLLCGSNGSGKSTVLNLIAEKLRLHRPAPFNNTPYFEDYLDMCRYELSPTVRRIPRESAILTSDGVFDFLLDLRAINEGVDRRREELYREYEATRNVYGTNDGFQMRSLADYDELKRRNEIRSGTKSSYVSKRLPKETDGRSNGESAYVYFTQKITEKALFLLDEPENSLSPMLQAELVSFLTDSARFYGCQFIISTHSPFLLSMRDAAVYDLDATPVTSCRWTELPHIRAYYDLFRQHEKEFQ
ncbi:MAG: AAA family ATPase [Clostridia bacterium]|nr:AAA family ATPase [Clostridia bacterium]